MKAEVEIEIDEKDCKKEECHCNKKRTKLEVIAGMIAGIVSLLALIAYMLIGFLMGIWHPTWVMFLAPMVVSSLIVAIGQKNLKKFNYPIFIVMIYVLFSSLFNLWHPLWVLFLTVPLYYSIIKLTKEIKSK